MDVYDKNSNYKNTIDDFTIMSVIMQGSDENLDI